MFRKSNTTYHMRNCVPSRQTAATSKDVQHRSNRISASRRVWTANLIRHGQKQERKPPKYFVECLSRSFVCVHLPTTTTAGLGGFKTEQIVHLHNYVIYRINSSIVVQLRKLADSKKSTLPPQTWSETNISYNMNILGVVKFDGQFQEKLNFGISRLRGGAIDYAETIIQTLADIG